MVNPNQTPLDQYTLLHIGFGFILQQAGVGLPVTALVSLAWEYVIEPRYKEIYPEVFPAPSQDSTANRTLDTVAVLGGWMAAHALSKAHVKGRQEW